jgi:hypothetical protein
LQGCGVNSTSTFDHQKAINVPGSAARTAELEAELAELEDALTGLGTEQDDAPNGSRRRDHQLRLLCSKALRSKIMV